MTEKIVLLSLIIALMPPCYWLGKTIVYLILCKYFGVNVTYTENVDGMQVTKKVRVNSKTSYEELVALYKKKQEQGRV